MEIIIDRCTKALIEEKFFKGKVTKLKRNFFFIHENFLLYIRYN